MSSSSPNVEANAALAATFDRVIDIRFAASTTPTIDNTTCVSYEELLESPSRFLPDTETSALIVCDIGIRSNRAVQELRANGYSSVVSLAGGMEAWLDADLPVDQPGHLTPEQYRRYDRQIKLPGIGVEGQTALADASVAIVGVGGLGVPVLSYLAGAGVGRLTVIDSGDIELSNLHRQTIYRTASIGSSKPQEAAAFASALNPDIEIRGVHVELDNINTEQILRGHDIVVVCTDSFLTAHIINAAAVNLRITMVFGSVYRTEGQLAVFDARTGACYACVFPESDAVQGLDCSIVGVLGPVTGVIGAMQATEVLNLITATEPPTARRLSLYDSADRSLDNVAMRKRPDCTVCGSPNGG